jgi:hypothetical protein
VGRLQLIHVPSASPRRLMSKTEAAKAPTIAEVPRAKCRMRRAPLDGGRIARRSRNSRSAIPHPPKAAKQRAALTAKCQPPGRHRRAMTATTRPMPTSSARRVSDALRALALKNSRRLASDSSCDSTMESRSDFATAR